MKTALIVLLVASLLAGCATVLEPPKYPQNKTPTIGIEGQRTNGPVQTNLDKDVNITIVGE